MTLDSLNQYANQKSRVNLSRPFKPFRMILVQTKEAYPKWYQSVVVKKNCYLKSGVLTASRDMHCINGGWDGSERSTATCRLIRMPAKADVIYDTGLYNSNVYKYILESLVEKVTDTII